MILSVKDGSGRKMEMEMEKMEMRRNFVRKKWRRRWRKWR